MRIAFITNTTPYPENRRGTSAHPYHIAKGRTENVSLDTYSFDTNNLTDEETRFVERELGTTVHKIALPWCYNWVFRLRLLFIRTFLLYPLPNYIKLKKKDVETINKGNYDGIWIYGGELTRIERQFKNIPIVHTIPDSVALYYHRMLGQRFVLKSLSQYWRCVVMYRKFARLEKNLQTLPENHYHMVGRCDAEFLKRLCPSAQVHFLRHPHYEIQNDGLKKKYFTSPKTGLLIAGQYNYYMKQDADQLISAMAANATKLTPYYTLTIVGRGWERHAEALEQAGYETHHIAFAPSYIEEICRHDIQITPISIGTGTKGKVLDALANGLLVIGTRYALENIAVESGKSCIEYKDANEAMEILKDIPLNRERYETIAREGQKAVLKHHNPRLIASELFGIFRKRQ